MLTFLFSLFAEHCRPGDGGEDQICLSRLCIEGTAGRIVLGTMIILVFPVSSFSLFLINFLVS